MSKYNRYQSVVSKNSEESSDYWLNRVKENLEKGAVKPRVNDDIYNQISSIMNTQSKFKSVDAAVEDMKRRSGFAAHVENISKQSNDSTTKKIAKEEHKLDKIKKHLEDALNLVNEELEVYEDKVSEKQYNSKKEIGESKISEPKVFKYNSEIKKTLENMVQDSAGTMDAVIIKEKLTRMYGKDVPDPAIWEDRNFLDYIMKLNNSTNKQEEHEHHNLGRRDMNEEVDTGNTDFMAGLMPVKF